MRELTTESDIDPSRLPCCRLVSGSSASSCIRSLIARAQEGIITALFSMSHPGEQGLETRSISPSHVLHDTLGLYCIAILPPLFQSLRILAQRQCIAIIPSASTFLKTTVCLFGLHLARILSAPLGRCRRR